MSKTYFVGTANYILRMRVPSTLKYGTRRAEHAGSAVGIGIYAFIAKTPLQTSRLRSNLVKILGEEL